VSEDRRRSSNADADLATLVVSGSVARKIELPRSDASVEALLSAACADASARTAVVVFDGGSRCRSFPIDVVGRGHLTRGCLHVEVPSDVEAEPPVVVRLDDVVEIELH